MTKDLSYLDQGLFTTFFANTPAGEEAWRVIAEQNQGAAKVLSIHKKTTITQLKNAGYSIEKAKKPTKLEIENIFKELEFLDQNTI